MSIRRKRRSIRSPHQGSGRSYNRRSRQNKDQAGLTSVKTALRYLLANHDRMLEERAHALMFLGELKALQQFRTKLTGISYQRDAYSVYADEISQTLDRMNLPSRSVYRGEHRVPVYDTREVTEPEIQEKARGVLDSVQEVTSGLSTDEIVEICRQVPEVRHAQLNHSIDLSTMTDSGTISHLRKQVEGKI